MITKYMLHKSLGAPIMMTNLYPFLLGNAALKHERIESFPEVGGAGESHPGGPLRLHGRDPHPFATEWTLRKKGAGDRRRQRLGHRRPAAGRRCHLGQAASHDGQDDGGRGAADGYAQFPGSDCLNGGVIKVRDGHKLMSPGSHHYLLLVGHHRWTSSFPGKGVRTEIEEI
jgi:hypothetical protein